MLDLKNAVEKMIEPDHELEGVLLLAMARRPDGKVQVRVYTVPLDEHERLLETMRRYLEEPRDEYRRE